MCDAYDAMRAERLYGRAPSVEAALDELRANAGTQFDPELVQMFCERVIRTAEPVRGA